MSVLARVPVDRIASEVPRVDMRRTALAAAAGALYGLGWLVAQVLRWVLAALTLLLYGLGRSGGWAYAAFRVGWSDAMAGNRRRGPA